MSEPERRDGQLEVDEVLELVVRDSRAPARDFLRGELVAPAVDLVARFTATLVASRRRSAPTRWRAGGLCAGSGRSPGPRT